MGITTKFTTAIHTLLVIYFFSDKKRVTSNFIAESVNTNPVVIRRILSQLKKAGLITVLSGKNGSKLSKDPNFITLLDVFKAVESVDNLFNIHENSNPLCPVGKNIHDILDVHLKTTQRCLENSLEEVTLNDLIEEINEKENLL